MARLPSEKTQLANARREIANLEKTLTTVRGECTHYRARATKAEQALGEWKVRFDKLLEFRQATAQGKEPSL
jgi:predicted  nucleic acid-binding Zn-ribbon protein